MKTGTENGCKEEEEEACTLEEQRFKDEPDKGGDSDAKIINENGKLEQALKVMRSIRAREPPSRGQSEFSIMHQRNAFVAKNEKRLQTLTRRPYQVSILTFGSLDSIPKKRLWKSAQHLTFDSFIELKSRKSKDFLQQGEFLSKTATALVMKISVFGR